MRDPLPPSYVLYASFGKSVSAIFRTYAPNTYQLVCEHLRARKSAVRDKWFQSPEPVAIDFPVGSGAHPKLFHHWVWQALPAFPDYIGLLFIHTHTHSKNVQNIDCTKPTCAPCLRPRGQPLAVPARQWLALSVSTA